MSYRCQRCKTATPAGKPELTITTLRGLEAGRLKGTIARIERVCQRCKATHDAQAPAVVKPAPTPKPFRRYRPSSLD